jgi:inosose dehydratase
MKFGFGGQLWLREDHFENWARMLDEMSLEGLDGFEHCYSYLIEHSEHRAAELRRLLEMHDLELASYYTGCSFLDRERLPGEMAEVERRCRFVAEVGGQNVLLDGGSKRRGSSPLQLDERIKMTADAANKLGEYARSCGLTLSWHQHWGSIFDDRGAFEQLMALTDPQSVRFCPDVGQLVLSGWDPVEVVRRHAHRVGFVHYKDVAFAGRPRGELWPSGPVAPTDEGAYGVDSRGRWVELGRGVVDFPAVTEVLRSVGYDGWLVDDFDFTCYDVRASVRACKDYVNQALGIWTERDIRRGLAPQWNS